MAVVGLSQRQSLPDSGMCGARSRVFRPPEGNPRPHGSVQVSCGNAPQTHKVVLFPHEIQIISSSNLILLSSQSRKLDFFLLL